MVDEPKLGGLAIPRRRWPFTRRQVFAQIVVAAVILISGIAIGTGGTILALKERIARFPFPPPGPEGRMEGADPNRPINRWREELSLTDEQALKIREVLSSSFKAARDRWRQISEAEQTEREAFVKSMKDILTPEQFAKWQDEYTQRARHFDRWRRGGPGRPGGPDGPDRRDGPDGGRRGMRGRRGGPDSDPNRPPDFRRDGRRDFGPDRPPEPGRERPPEFGPGGPPEPNQLDQRP